MPQKIVINDCFGGFGMSKKAVLRLRELGLQEAILELMPDDDPKEWFEKWQEAGGNDYKRWNFNTPQEAEDYFNSQHGLSYIGRCCSDERDNPLLVQVVKELGAEVNSAYSKLVVLEIPDGIDWQVSEYDGYEHIAQVHQTWYYKESD